MKMKMKKKKNKEGGMRGIQGKNYKNYGWLCRNNNGTLASKEKKNPTDQFVTKFDL